MELATSPLEVVINDVNDEAAEEGETAASQWGKKEAAETEGLRAQGQQERWQGLARQQPAAEKGGKGKGKGGACVIHPAAGG